MINQFRYFIPYDAAFTDSFIFLISYYYYFTSPILAGLSFSLFVPWPCHPLSVS